MSAQQNRPNGRGGRGRGGYPGQNRGGYSGPRRGGPQGHAPISTHQQFQPSYPPPQYSFNAIPPYQCPPPNNTIGFQQQTPGGGGNTVKEETITTYTAEGKTVKKVRTVINEVGQVPEYGNRAFTPNHQAQANAPPPFYPGQYQNTMPPQFDTGQARPLMSQPLLPTPTYDERPVSGRPPRSRGGPPRGRGRNIPSNQGLRNQPRSKSMDRQTLLQGQRSLSLADIAIDDDVTGDTTQVQEAEKMKKKPKKKQKPRSQADDSVGNTESSLNDILSGLDKLSPSNASESKHGPMDSATQKAEYAEPRNGRPRQRNKNKNAQDEHVHNLETVLPDHARKISESSDTSNGPDEINLYRVFDFVVKKMNGKGSPEEIRTKSGLFPMFNLDMVEQWFRRFSTRFKCIVRDGRVVVVFAYGRELNYCLDYYSKRTCMKNGCQRYHICKDFLSGNCHFGPECNRSHNFFDRTSQNMSLSEKFGYTKKYNNQQLLALMQCRYPRVCHEWNQQKACRDPCCDALHMCENFFQRRCEDGEYCNYGHDRMSEHNKPIVEAYEMTKWADVNFGRIIYIKRSIEKKEHEPETENDDDGENDDVEDTGRPTDGDTVDASKSDEVVDLCDQFLLDNCKNEDCPLYHNETLRLPYLWQVKIRNQWVDCSQSEEIEKEFCALTDKSEPFYVCESSLGIIELAVIEFYPTIRAKLLDDAKDTEARRLSTKSFKEKSRGQSDVKTQWRWYKEERHGAVELFTPDTLQHTLESKYLAGQKEYRFFTPGLPYIDFMAMCVVSSGNYYKIHRRPLLRTSSSIAEKKRLPILSPDVSVRVTLPKGWDVWDTNNDMELVKLAKTSLEYEQMEDRFFQHLKRERLIVDGIFRVQNYTLWDQFSSKEHSMKATLQRVKKGASALNKRYLFHGTETFDAVKGICRSNIDPRRAGKNDTMFGEGAYFAAEARLAHQYTLAPDRYVFIANVLVGEFCKGDRSYRIPPAIPDTDREYDSCVDDVDNPMKYVLFDRNQYYPEYLMWYHDAD